jgi:hypothetical protein
MSNTKTDEQRAMTIQVASDYEYYSELRSDAGMRGMPLATDDVTPEMAELVDELYTRAVLAEQLPYETNELQATIAPVWSIEPAVEQVEVTLASGRNGRGQSVSHTFARGPWVRRAQHTVERLRGDGALGESEQAYRLLIALAVVAGAANRLNIPPLQPPPIVDQSLEDFGVERLGEGSLEPERPVLVNARLLEEAIDLCEAAGAMETGGAALGKIIRLPEPLPGTKTRIVTILSAMITDSRHIGSMTRFNISPEALVEAAEIADVRGRLERPISIVHTHGWGCGDCNQKACLLAECFPSLQDYELESLFPTKALLLPIAGRKLGAAGRRPILQIHAWNGGELKPIRWQTYFE